MSDKLPAFPAVAPGGELIPHLSARYRRQQMDMLYEAMGGFDKALAYYQKNDENYGRFMDQYWKGQAKAVTTEVTAGDDLSGLIKKLDQEDRMKNATVIDATATEISDAVEKERE